MGRGKYGQQLLHFSRRIGRGHEGAADSDAGEAGGKYIRQVLASNAADGKGGERDFRRDGFEKS